MAERRPEVPKDLKLALVKEAGMKCANPGCSNYRTHMHHIREWHVYKVHSKEDMIAVCPSCHDQIHNGRLPIADDIIYRWKNIKRTSTKRDLLYVELNEGEPAKLLLGTIAVTGQSGLIVFELSTNNRLSFRLINEDIFLINLEITSLDGKTVISVVENHVKYELEGKVNYDRRAGKLRLTALFSDDLLPDWALSQIQQEYPDFASDGILLLLDVEVIAPGLVRIQGIWPSCESAVLITEHTLSLLRPGLERPISLLGDGENSLIVWEGSIVESMFKFS